MAVDQRKEVSEAYSSDDWKARVRTMSDAQVTAIYLRLRAQGKI